jgi:hypothetical protein
MKIIIWKVYRLYKFYNLPKRYRVTKSHNKIRKMNNYMLNQENAAIKKYKAEIWTKLKPNKLILNKNAANHNNLN